MADEFSFTDSEDERAVEDVLSQALDQSVLEQIAAINCSSFSSKDNLPFDLENRFRKLKSLPTATTATGARFPPSKSKSFIPRSGADSVDFERVSDRKNGSDKPSPFTGDPKQRSEEYSDEKKGSNSRSKPKSDFRKTKSLKSESKTDSSESSPSSDDSEQHSDGNLDEKIGTNYSRSKPKSSSNSKKFRETKSLKSKSRNDSSESPLEHSDGNLDEKIGTDSRSKLKSSSSNSRKTKSLKSKSRTDSWSVSSPESESRSVSPARRGIGCLWCSPKKEKRKQGKENLNRLSSFSSSLGNDYEYDGEFLKTFSMKEQKKIMRKAMKEEEKINREAEKIVKWAKQASSRMMDVDVSGVVDDELSVSDLEK